MVVPGVEVVIRHACLLFDAGVVTLVLMIIILGWTSILFLNVSLFHPLHPFPSIFSSSYRHRSLSIMFMCVCHF